MDELLISVKKNLIIEHGEDDDLLTDFISASISYAEAHQHHNDGYYQSNPMSMTTRQAIIMLASHLYESRDGSTAGMLSDSPASAQQVWNTVNMLLRLDRDWKV